MNPQDMLALLTGPQGLLLLIGVMLLVLIGLLYRRTGKLLAAICSELFAVREAIQQLADRADAAQSEVPLPSMPVPEGEQRAYKGEPSEMVPSGVAPIPDELPASVASSLAGAVPETKDLADAEGYFSADVEEMAPHSVTETAAEPMSDAEDLFDAGTGAASGEEMGAIGIVPEFSGENEEVAPEPLVESGADAEADAAEPFKSAGVSEDAFQFVVPDAGAVADLEPAVETVAFAAGDPEDVPSRVPGNMPADVDDFNAAAAGEAESASRFEFNATHSGSASTDADAVEAAFVEQAAGMPDEFVDDSPPDMAETRDSEEPVFEEDMDEDDSLSRQAPSVGPLDAGAEVPPEPAMPSPVPGQETCLIPLPGNPDQPEVGVARCSACGRKIAYPMRLSGKRMRCPACRSVAVLP
jgi:hypothetical protein